MVLEVELHYWQVAASSLLSLLLSLGLSRSLTFILGGSAAARRKMYLSKLQNVQSGRSSLAKHGGAYFSAVYGFMKDPIAAPGPFEIQEC